jgi:hypothetical protein
MTLRQVYTVKNDRLVIDLPAGMRGRKKVLVTVEDALESEEEKMLLLAQAATDPLFLADVKEVTNDFKDIDQEQE